MTSPAAFHGISVANQPCPNHPPCFFAPPVSCTAAADAAVAVRQRCANGAPLAGCLGSKGAGCASVALPLALEIPSLRVAPNSLQKPISHFPLLYPQDPKESYAM